jgi:FG-GAP-like repeat
MLISSCRSLLGLSITLRRFLLVIGTLMLSATSDKASGAPSIDGTQPAIYVWQQSLKGDWQTASNWAPARFTPAPSDILVFNIGGTIIVTNVPNQTIGRLTVSGNTAVNLQTAIPVILTVSGNDGDDLSVDSGSSLNFNGANALSLNLATGATANISGSITFSSPGTAADRLIAVDPLAIVFNTGAMFTAAAGFAGNPFGTTNLNSVVFNDGSAYISISGADPFGAAEPNSVVVFRKGSLFSLRGDALPSFSGRSYGNFEMNCPGRDVVAEGGSAFVVDDLMLTAGRLSLRLSGDPGHSIKGNITTASGTQLIFSSGTVRLNGTATQTISGSGIEGADGGSTIAIDNLMDVALNRPFVGWNVALINGIVHTGPLNHLGVAGDLSRTNGYVDGWMRRILFSLGSFDFDVGTANGYSPVVVNVTSGNSPTILNVSAAQGAQPNISNPSKALSRYWTVFEQTPMTADITFHYLESDIPSTANEANFVIQKYNGGFTQPVGSIDTAANTFRINDVSNFAQDWTLAEPGALFARSAVFDYDGDGKSDLSVFRPSVGEWYYQQSSTNVTRGFGFGTLTDKVATADFTGDGKTDIAFWRPSTGDWYVLRSEDSTYFAFPFGANGDIPVPADYDGDQKSDAAVYRPSAQTWFILKSTGGVLSVPFGLSDDIPVPADYDGDGKADVGIYRPSLGQWWNLRSSNGSVFAATFGSPTDKPVAGDYTGDGKADIAFYRPSEGNWYILRSENFTYYAFPFGNSTDKPAPADYDGDGRFDAAVFRPSDTNWYILKSTGGLYIQQYGAANDIPLPGAFVP